jgi:ubiquinone/menaquinone biosynthesis C-methylase UbiE
MVFMVPASPHDKPDYGTDAPEVVRNFAVLGGTGIVIGAGCWACRATFAPWSYALANMAFWPGLSLALTALVMLWGSKVGKLRFRDKLIDQLKLQGDERVLDVGCGRGLMVLGIAKRLTTGRAVGIDRWQEQDQSGNAITTTEENARSENVAERVELHTGDMRQLPFPDASYAAVVSTWAIHNIYDAAGRRQALAEIIRVLRPGGIVALADIRHTAEYRAAFKELGMQEVCREGPSFLFVIPTYVVWGRKAQSAQA